MKYQEYFEKAWKLVPNRLRRLILQPQPAQKKWIILGGVSIFLVIVYQLSQGDSQPIQVYHTEKKEDYKDARVLDSQSDSFLEGKEKMFSKQVKEMLLNQEHLREENKKLLDRIESFERGKRGGEEMGPPSPLSLSDSPEGDYSIHTSQAHPDSGPAAREVAPALMIPKTFKKKAETEGEDLISFPVQDAPPLDTSGIVLPLGSYVKGKLLTGVEAPEGRTYPVLMQLDFAYTLPGKNPRHQKLDLSGCFMIAKAEGDLSTERVQMQAHKLSCVSRSGKMFEREISGFVADDKDNSFSVIGNVNSKQDRVAAMAFLASIVEGVGKSIQQAQVTQQGFPTGGGQSVITGDQAKFMMGGSAANAAGLITQWYLRQAQNLLPTINVGSGQDIWVVMKESVHLPQEYFQTNLLSGEKNAYSYLSRVLD